MPAHFALTCQLCADLFRANQRVFVYCPNQQDAEAVDEVLWQFDAERFVPHNLAGEGPSRGAPVEISWQWEEAGSSKLLIAVARDISERRQAEELLQHMAHYDSLTGLPNRTLFFKIVADAIAVAQDKSWRIVVLMIGLTLIKVGLISMGGGFTAMANGTFANGENLLLIRDRRIVTAYMVEALRIFDHYHYRVSQQNALVANKELVLKRPPGKGERAWWFEDYNDPRKVKDRELFSG